MHSIRSKFLLLICGSIVGVFFLLAGLGTYYVQTVIEEDSTEMISLLIRQKSSKLDAEFQSVEDAVMNARNHIIESINVQKFKNDSIYRTNILDEIALLSAGEAKVSGCVCSLYFRLEPEAYGGTAGFFMKNDGEDNYIKIAPTDLTKFEKTDREHVGWFYEPIQDQEALWMEPYSNENINIYMISYVAPVYIDGKLLGVVGMDIDMTRVQSVVDSVHYDNGFGFIVGDNGNLIYHKDYPKGLKAALFDVELKELTELVYDKCTGGSGDISFYKWRGKKQRLASEKLENGMLFSISVPEKDIMKLRTKMGKQMILVLGMILVLVFLVAWRVMVWIVRPIQELTVGSSRIARGELNAQITYKSEDEIGKLADSIRMIATELQEYISYIRTQAYTDAMTGVRNKTAYLDLIKLLDKKIQEDMADFAVAVFDVNGLKRMNDEFGHEQGDMLITDAAGVIKRVFGEEQVYRIGGDEFIVVAEAMTEKEMSEAFERYDEIVKKFNERNEKYDQPVSMSKGASFYVRGEDRDYNEVFKRADEAMYKDKARHYQGRRDRRRG